MLSELAKLPEASKIMNFVTLFYGEVSKYYWTDEVGKVWEVTQGDGGEQGDPLMPQLFALGLSPALREAKQKLQEDESLFAFLDDLYLLASKPRMVEAFRIVADTVQRVSGIYTNLGKLHYRCIQGQGAPHLPV